MAKKYYAVKKGIKPGIYETWAECQQQTNGYSGAEYKSFTTYNEALQYIKYKTDSASKQQQHVDIVNTDATAYVDGSYDSATNQFSCGVVFFHNGKEEHFSERFDDESLAEMNNVAGEIKGAEKAIRYCLDNKIKSITIYHDYEGISKWCTGEWQAKKDGTKAYKDFFDEASKSVDIHFVKVKGHSGDKYNEMADQLAKNALQLINTKNVGIVTKEEQKLAKNKGVFINREEIRTLIVEAGNKQWQQFEASELVKAGNPYRCNIVADGKKAILDFYYNNDGTTTITPTGTNLEISTVIKALLEEGCTYTNNAEGKTYSFKKLPSEWATKLIEYLTTLVGESVIHEEVDKQPVHDVYRFTSKIGDLLTVNVYENGTVTLQGKPAYLYGEAISLLSYCDKVSVDDIVDTINSFHNVDVKIEDVRSEMEVLLPRSYKNIDDMILKLLSPSISLRKVKIPLEDYSCYAFSALRALEGYIKYLFGLKSITIGHNFGGIFDKGALTASISLQVADVNYQSELEKLYGYLVGNRHVIFHTEQLLIGTTVLEDKQEADEIVNNVLNFIETSYININK